MERGVCQRSRSSVVLGMSVPVATILVRLRPAVELAVVAAILALVESTLAVLALAVLVLAAILVLAAVLALAAAVLSLAAAILVRRKLDIQVRLLGWQMPSGVRRVGRAVRQPFQRRPDGSER